MKKLILHMGFPKTGSSALQVCLAQNRDTLAQHGAIYPVNRKDSALEGKVSSGNGSELCYYLRRPYWKPRNLVFKGKIAYWLAKLPENSSLIFSSEKLCLQYDLQRLIKLQKQAMARNIEMQCVFYIKSPVGYALSFHNQLVKVLGYAHDFSYYIRNHLDLPFRKLLELKQHGINIEVRNHDHLKQGVENDFICSYLRLQGSDIRFDKKRVNRSLNKNELQMMIALNKVKKLKEYCSLISDTLISSHPVLNYTRTISRDDFNYLLEKYGNLVTLLNKDFPGLELDFSDPRIVIEE